MKVCFDDQATALYAVTVVLSALVGCSAVKPVLGGYKALNIAGKNISHLEVMMPLTEARDDEDAALKMSAIVETAIRDAFSPPFRTKIFEYENVAFFGERDHHRVILVDGLGCENWSCLAGGPITTKAKLVKTRCHDFKGQRQDQSIFPCFAYSGFHGIGFSKITGVRKENGLIAGHRYRFEEKTVDGFDYEQLFLRISTNLPDWAFFYIAPDGNGKDELLAGPAVLHKGMKIKI